MSQFLKIKKLKNSTIIVIILTIFFLVIFFLKKDKRNLIFNSPKIITLNDNGLIFKTSTSANLIAEFLRENKINLAEKDLLFPNQEEKIFSNTVINIRRAQKIKILVDGEKIETYALGKNISEALWENNISLSRLDKTEPKLSFPIQADLTVSITRINIEEKTEKEAIDFKTVIKTDSKLGWREKKIEQKGEKGEKEITYEITYKNGKEIFRKILNQKISLEPINQIETQGTYVKIGKKHKGQASWYAWQGGLFAANPWLPMGSYVKVTNTANGKSVIVQINDRGPFVPGRIIDLDKVAFQKIASVGAGVIGVKMEEILN